MSWREARQSIRWLAIAAALLSLPSLGGCGYHPVYGDWSPSSVASDKLAGVAIAPIGHSEVGLRLRESLLDSLSGSRETTRPTHELQVKYTDVDAAILVQPDASVTRYNYSLSASYTLLDHTTNQVVTSGTASATTSYSVVDSEYATLVGKRNAQSQAAATVAREISMRVALYFRNGVGAATPAASGKTSSTPTPPLPPGTPQGPAGLQSPLNPTGEALPGTNGASDPSAPSAQ